MIRVKIPKRVAIRKLEARGWKVKLSLPRKQSAVLIAPDGHEFYGDPRDLLEELPPIERHEGDQNV